MQSVPGIANVVSSVLLTDLAELGTLNRKQVAALAGLAPFNFDSGGMRGKRRIFAGRVGARCALFQATQVAVRHNPLLKGIYEGLLARGKEKMVALVACARRLLVMLNAMIRTMTPWNPNLGGAAV